MTEPDVTPTNANPLLESLIPNKIEPSVLPHEITTDPHGQQIVKVTLLGGGIVTLDKSDWDRFALSGIAGHSWFRQKPSKTSRHAYVALNLEGKTQLLHRFVLSAQPGDRVGYRSDDRLDLRRTNLKYLVRFRRDKLSES